MSEYNLPGKPLRLHEFDFLAFTKTLYDKGIKFTNGKRIGEEIINGQAQFIGLSQGQLEVVSHEARFKVLAAGRRFGKCQDIDSTVQLADGSIRKMGDLIGQDIEINSMTDDYKYVKTKASVHYNAKVPVYKITTKYGSELVRTQNHPLYTSLGWGSVETGELKVGTRIAFPTNNPNVGTGTFDKNQLALLGLLLGDGSFTGKAVRFSIDKSRVEAIADFESLLDAKFSRNIAKGRNVYEYYISQENSICKLVKSTGLKGTNSHTKFIPDFVFKLDREHISHFLSYIFFTDGWNTLNGNNPRVGYCSASKELATGIRTLLSRMGVISSIRLKTMKSGDYVGNTYYTVDILNNEEVKKFEDRIGIKHKPNIYLGGINSFNSQVTTMPLEFCQHFSDKLKSKINFPKQELMFGRVRPDRAVGKSTLASYCRSFMGEFEEEQKLIESDLYWDEIVSIECLGDRDTAHLEVPEYYNYVNEAIEHNTVTCVILALAALLQPNRLVIIVAPEHTHVEKVFKELYAILVTQLKMANKGANDGTIARNTKGDYVIQLKNGSRIEGKSGTNPDSLAGDAVDLYIFDEAAVEPNLEHIWSLARPALADKKGSAIFISSPRGRNDFYRLYKLGQKGMGQASGLVPIKDDNMTSWASWSFPSWKNPFIPAEEYESAKLESIEKGKYENFKQEWDADFDAVTDVAFPEFRALKKVKDENGKENVIPYHVHNYNFDPRNGPWFAACDFNVARPASTVYLQIDKDNNIIIFDELFRNATDAKLQAQFILEKQSQLGLPYTAVIGDVSGSFSRAGVNEFTLMAGVLGHDPYGVRQGRDTGNHMLHQFLAVPYLDRGGYLITDEYGQPKTYPKLFVASNCHNTIHAFEAAKRKMGKDGSIKDDYTEFKTGHEGLLDAIRYALVAIFKEKQGVKVIKGI